MTKIRGYKDSDYPQVKKNLQEANRFDPVLDGRENLKRKIENNPGSILVAVSTGSVVGNIYLIEDGWSAFLFRLAVQKQFQRKGIGSLLMDTAEKRLRKKGYSEVSVLIREEECDRLRGFYAKRGYKPWSKKHQGMSKPL